MPNKLSKKDSRKTTKSGPKRDKEYYNAILLEEIHGQMKTVIDAVENSRIASEHRDNEIRKEMNEQFEIVKSAIRRNSQDIQILKGDVQVLKTDVKEIRVEMRQIEKRLSDKIDKVGDRVDNHEERITNLETARL